MATYGTKTEADAYFLLRDFSGQWATFSATEKDQALQVATDQIDQLQFAGQKFSGTEQLLQFPRLVDIFASQEQHVWDVEKPSGDIVVPEEVKRANFEQAKFLLVNKGNSLICKLLLGITSISIGSTSESYDLGKFAEGFDRRTGLSLGTKSLLEKYMLTWY